MTIPQHHLLEDDINLFFEEVTERMDEQFLDDNFWWVMESVQCYKWVCKYYYEYHNPKHAARVIERAFRLYKLGG